MYMWSSGKWKNKTMKRVRILIFNDVLCIEIQQILEDEI